MGREITIALERYDRHVPFFTDIVSAPADISFRTLEVAVGTQPDRRHGADRHGRMFEDQEFDVCEQSLASYILARSRGAPFTATPVFPRRLFSHNHIFVNADAGIAKPADLAGKRIAIWSFQNTLAVLTKGDLKLSYDVPWEKVHWHVQNKELVPWTPPGELSVQSIPAGKDAGQMVVDGELDGIIHPLPPAAVLSRTDRVRRLFPDPKAEATAYFKRHGYCPIMHVLVFTETLVEKEPWLPKAMIDAWEDSKARAASFYRDPGYSMLVFGRNEFEWQRDTLGPDLWPSGLAANRRNLAQFIGYLVDQKLIDNGLPVERLFHPSVVDT